jgi:hypothetical protein
MTHHNLDELAKKEGINSEKVVDYTEANQGVDTQPKMSEIQTVEPKSSGKKGKGKKGKKYAGSLDAGAEAGTAPKTLKDKIRCSFCGNLMTQSSKLNWKEIPGKKIPKNADTGKLQFKSPGGVAGKPSGVFCDDCERSLEAGIRRDIKTAIIERTDGTVANIPVSDLPE